MRGGAVTLAERAAELAATGYRPDVLLVSSMIDLGLLRSLLAPSWGRVPAVLYLHETQLAYPDSPQLEPDASYAFTNWTSVLAADAVVFNSEFHRRSFFTEVRRLLRGFPDYTHEHLVIDAEAKASVLPVGVELGWVGERRDDGGPPVIVWNHRWEHDKAPEVFLAAVDRLAAEGHEFRLALCGEVFRQSPTDLEAAARHHAGRLVWLGNAPVDRYRAILSAAHIVVSTALQEFFGVAVVEAVAAGAWPVLPNRLSYPEVIPADYHAEALYAEGGLDIALENALGRMGPESGLAGSMRRFGWDRVAPAYDRHLDAVM
jgi:glycosyltransferase involved in cell wall biosynthesis